MTDNINQQLVNKIMDYFIKQDSPDLHLNSQISYIRNSVGDLVPSKINSNKDVLDIFSKTVLTQTKYTDLMKGFEIDLGYSYQGERFRMNFYNDQNGLNIAIRRLSTYIPNFTDIGLPENLKNFYLKHKGLILLTGPTGSGKSTSMASIIKYISENRKCHIITLEDPIEYVIKSNNSLINQREVGNNTKSWMNGIKYALRQDPDVIIVGEMRDLETIEAVLTLVETGHLVISTLHTIDAVQTVTRIINSFPEGEQSKIAVQLSMVLELVISQRLLPSKDNSGRICAREILINNSAIGNLIRRNRIPHIYGIMETQRKEGMITMDQSLAKFVAEDKLEKNIALGIVSNETAFNQMIDFYLEKYENERMTMIGNKS